MSKKTYRAESGIALDSSFAFHATSCEQCKLYEADKPATLALQCLEGSVLWKRENSTPAKHEHPERGPHWAAKSDVKRAMRYKGEE